MPMVSDGVNNLGWIELTSAFEARQPKNNPAGSTTLELLRAFATEAIEVHDARDFYSIYQHEKLETLTGLKRNDYLYKPKIIIFRAEKGLCHAYIMVDPREKKVPMSYSQLVRGIHHNEPILDNP